MQNEEFEKTAIRRATAKMDFFTHLAVYLIVCSALATINLLTTPRFFWAIYPIAGWGIGLLIHGFSTFILLSGLKERLIRNELRRLRES